MLLLCCLVYFYLFLFQQQLSKGPSVEQVAPKMCPTFLLWLRSSWTLGAKAGLLKIKLDSWSLRQADWLCLMDTVNSLLTIGQEDLRTVTC